MSAIRVIIFDDNKRIRDAAELLISSNRDFKFAGAFANCNNLIDDVTASSPDVIIMDIDMPGINGIEAVKIIHQNFPSVQVLMQTVFEDEENIFNAIRSGAGGYMLKNTKPLEMLESIRQVYAGGAPMTPLIAKKVLLVFQQQPGRNKPEDYSISVKEKEVLEHLVTGKSYKMIADAMNVNYDTIRKHMQHIYHKLHVSSMTEAVAKAINEKFFG